MIDLVPLFTVSLGQALRATLNLRSFYWFGVFPEMSESLATSLPTSLQNLYLEK
jgi:hypothetical protein